VDTKKAERMNSKPYNRAKLAEAMAKLELAKRGLSSQEDRERVLRKYCLPREEVERRVWEIVTRVFTDI
jgi:hypothetical protein